MIARYWITRYRTVTEVFNKERFIETVKEEWEYSHTDQKAESYVFTHKRDGYKIVVDVLMWQVAEELGLELLK